MRSRYTAFARGDAAYLERTWHPRTRPGSLELDDGTEWTGLTVIAAQSDGDSGAVEFRASWRRGAERGALHERSRFTRRGGRWFYLDGDVER
jgi:SEC-C motif domain protein